MVLQLRNQIYELVADILHQKRRNYLFCFDPSIEQEEVNSFLNAISKTPAEEIAISKLPNPESITHEEIQLLVSFVKKLKVWAKESGVQ
jgi:hypothetical protein